MSLLVSSLIRGMDEMETVAKTVAAYQDKNVGVELIAFTHDEKYWQRLEAILPALHCPLTFHGPYIKTEGTSEEGSAPQKFLFDSYERTLALAKKYNILHVVYHMTQLTFTNQQDADALRAQGEKNAERVMALGRKFNVPLLIENLPCPEGRLPLYSNQQYFDFFAKYPLAQSIIDIGHAHMMGLDIEKFLANYGSRVKAYHFHNNYGKQDEHNDIFDGSFNYKAFGKIFHRYTPSCNIVLEYEPHVNLSWDELKEQIAFVQAL